MVLLDFLVARGHTYLYLVESEREGGRVRQRIIGALGRKYVLLASGELERLAASLVRHSTVRSFCPTWRQAALPAPALAGQCCLGGSGSGSALPRCWASCLRIAVLSLLSSAPSSQWPTSLWFSGLSRAYNGSFFG
jgi:hypothetical protein